MIAKRKMFKVPEQYRLKTGLMGSDESYGCNGIFLIPGKMKKVFFNCQAADGMGWEHVSVSIPGAERCPTWEEMCLIKSYFWDEYDCVVQFHPPKRDYVNRHKYVLHLWRKKEFDFPLPPTILV